MMTLYKDTEEIKELLLPSREKIISVLQWLGLSEAKVKHSIGVADLAMKIAKEVENDGIAVDKKIVEVGALLHDIGVAKTFDDFSPEHSVIGADIIRKIGLPERVARCAEVHEFGGGVTRAEAEELKYPVLPLRDQYVPQEIEEKIVTISDLFIYILKEAVAEFGFKKSDPWKDPEAIIDAVFLYGREVYQKKLNRTIERSHPIMKRAYEVNKEFIKYVKPDFVKP
jgi:uncharacterized protein